MRELYYRLLPWYEDKRLFIYNTLSHSTGKSPQSSTALWSALCLYVTNLRPTPFEF